MQNLVKSKFLQQVYMGGLQKFFSPDSLKRLG